MMYYWGLIMAKYCICYFVFSSIKIKIYSKNIEELYQPYPFPSHIAASTPQQSVLHSPLQHSSQS